MFKFVYTYIGKKINISDKTLLAARIIVPVALLSLVSHLYPAPPSSSTENDSNNTNATEQIND